MESLAVDLHIHSCLSPCAERDMTPNNIAGMAMLKQLDMIAVTDHNRAQNARAVARAAEEYGVLVLPGMEAQSREDVHLLCYFPDFDLLEEFDDWHYRFLPDMPAMPQLFGEQWLMDEEDCRVGDEPRLLLQSTTLSIDEVCQKVLAMGGAMVPAHVNRQANSLLYNLGFIPPGLPVTTLEVSRLAPSPEGIGGYRTIYSSDAHDLGAILERDNFLRVEERSVAAVIRRLKEKSGNIG